MLTLPTLTHRFSAIPIKIPAIFFVRHKQDYFKIYKKASYLDLLKNHSEKNNKVERISFSWFQDLLYSYITRMCDIDGRIDRSVEYNRETRNNTHTIKAKWLLTKVWEKTQWKKDNIFNGWCWINCHFINRQKKKKKKNLNINLTSFTKINSD